MTLRDWRSIFAGGLVSAALVSTSGCLSYLHPVPPAPTEVITTCKTELSPCGRSHVYVFFVHGLDPFDYANLSGVRDYVNELGFPKTYYGQFYHKSQFEKEIRTIRSDDPEARFVLIGFSLGANMVRSIANTARNEGITIDLLVYLGGNTLGNEERDQPDNVARVVNILATGWIFNGVWMDRAENIEETDVYHFGSPTHPETLSMLARELTGIASERRVADVPTESAKVTQPASEVEALKPNATHLRSSEPYKVVPPTDPYSYLHRQ
jgi:hypothetical protein